MKDKALFANLSAEYLPVLRDPLAMAFNLSTEAKNSLGFSDLYKYCDIIVAEQFEGLPARYNFTD